MPAVKFSAHKRFHIIKSTTRLWDTSTELIQHLRFLYILSGEGHFSLDGKIYSYCPKGIILLRVGQKPVFQQDNETAVLVIAFDTFLSEDFLKKKSFSPDFADTYKQAEHLCEMPLLTLGLPVPNKQDRVAIANLTGILLGEIQQKPAHHIKLIRSCIEMIVTLLGRNNIRYLEKEQNPHEDTLAEMIIEHLTGELLLNKPVKIPDLLIKFNSSEDVVNICIQNRTGMSLKKLILRYKTDLFKSRMLKMDIITLTPYLQHRFTAHKNH